MLGDVSWEECRRRYAEFWARENHDRPLLWITAPREAVLLEKIIPHQPTQNSLHWISGPHFYGEYHRRITADTTSRWLDTGLVVKRARFNFERTYYAGEAYPLLYPDFGPDIMAAVLGCDLVLGEHTTWCQPNIGDWSPPPEFALDEANAWWKRTIDASREMVDDARGEYFVSITDIHPGVDTLMAMRGPERLCVDLVDYPDAVKDAMPRVWEPFKTVYEQLHRTTAENLSGSSNWMGAWHPGRWHTVSADFMTMISPRMFEEVIVPQIVRETTWLDDSIFHLDGPEALRHVDRLLEIPQLTGIAWLPGEGKPPISEWIPVLRKIQAAGKVIQAEVHDWEVPILVSELQPEGALYVTSCRTQGEAEALFREAGRRRRQLS